MSILIYAQLTNKNYIHTVFFELASKAKELSKKLNNTEVNAVIMLPDGLNETYKEAFRKTGLNKVYYYESNKFGNYSTELYFPLIVDLIHDIKPEIVLIGATSQGRDLAPRISCSLHTGLTADCTGLDINEQGLLAATRPTFGGQLMATILCKNMPQMATVRPNVFKTEDFNETLNTEFICCEVKKEVPTNVKILDFKSKIEELNDLDSADIIVAGGKGLKNKEGFELLKKFASSLDAPIAATRGAVEMGIAPASIQVGQTGKNVSPKLYIACGISGAIQHIVGMTNSDYIIAINNDESAPIFEVADMGIVGDIFEILPKLIS